MTKSFHLLFILILLSIFSCEKLPSNGDLDGQWQLMQINTKEHPYDSVYSQSVSKKEDRIYWCFQLDLLMVNETPVTPLVCAQFNHTDGCLNLIRIYKNKRSVDSLITDPNSTLLEPIGIHGNTESYVVEKLNREKMILRTNIKQLVFRKF